MKKTLLLFVTILVSIVGKSQDSTRAIHAVGMYVGGNGECLDLGLYYMYAPKIKNQPLELDLGYTFRQSSGIEAGARFRCFQIKKKYELLAAVHYTYHPNGKVKLPGPDDEDYTYKVTEAHNIYYFLTNRFWLEDRMAALQLNIGYSQALNPVQVGHSQYVPDDRRNEAVRTTKGGLLVDVGIVFLFSKFFQEAKNF